MVPYGFGAAVFTGWFFDADAVQYFPATVQGKTAKRDTTIAYTVTFDAWGPYKGPNALRVEREIFDRLGTRMDVCLGVNAGDLRHVSVTLGECPVSLLVQQTKGPINVSQVALGVAAYKWKNSAFALGHLLGPAMAGNPEAQFFTGMMCWDNILAGLCGNEAMRLFHKAAAQGHARAMNIIGFSYENAIIVRKDIAKAIEWYELAAAMREPRALNNLGLLYDNGDGVPRDPERARQLYGKAVAQGHGSAMNNLAILYAEGDGVPQDEAEARRLWGLAANQGYPESMYSLGMSFKDGNGAKRDAVLAYKWLDLAVSRLSPGEWRDRAVSNRDALAAGMTATQIGEARETVRAWLSER